MTTINKAGYVISTLSAKAIKVKVGEDTHTFDLTNEAVLLNLLERGTKRYMDAAKAGKEGKVATDALQKAASEMAAGRIGRGSFDADTFMQAVKDAEDLGRIEQLSNAVKSAPKKVQTELAQAITARTVEIAIAMATKK